MTKHFRHAGVTVLLLSACLSYAQAPGIGRIHIQPMQSYSGAETLPKPLGIVLYDFAATSEEVKLNKSVLNRARTRLSKSPDDKKTELAHKIVEEFSNSLIKDLEKTGLPISRGVDGELPPNDSLVVQGDFLLADEGNRAQRMAVGLGMGASKVMAHVESYFTKPDKNIMLTEFQAVAQSSRKPGAAETMGAGAGPEAAATIAGATELSQGVQGDTHRMANAVAKEISKAMSTQGWTKEMQ